MRATIGYSPKVKRVTALGHWVTTAPFFLISSIMERLACRPTGMACVIQTMVYGGMRTFPRHLGLARSFKLAGGSSGRITLGLYRRPTNAVFTAKPAPPKAT